MDLTLSEAEQAFRDEARAWLAVVEQEAPQRRRCRDPRTREETPWT